MPPNPDAAGTPANGSAPARFRETALASGLVGPAELDAAEIELQETLDRRTAAAADWDKGIADRLVRQKALTRFQAREILAGRRLFRLGQYTVLDEIGRGGMGQVFLAEHCLMGREVAVKVLPRARSTPEYEAAFRREIRMLASLDHENLVRALDAGYDAKVYYLVTEFVPGFDLRKQVRRYGPLDALAAGAVMTQAARGLAYAHDHGVVHRDVKPGNLLVTQDGRVKVLDLGLAGSAFDPETQQAGRVIGTMDYMAPEQIRAGVGRPAGGRLCSWLHALFRARRPASFSRGQPEGKSAASSWRAARPPHAVRSERRSGPRQTGRGDDAEIARRTDCLGPGGDRTPQALDAPLTGADVANPDVPIRSIGRR